MIKQLVGEYKWYNLTLMESLELAHILLQQVFEVRISHVPWSDNEIANEFTQQAFDFG